MTSNMKALLLTLVLTGFCVVLFYGSNQYLHRYNYFELKQRLDSAHTVFVFKFQNQIGKMQQDLFGLKLALIESGHLASTKNRGDKDELIALFKRRIDQGSLISQIRWLDDRGMEKVRLDRKLLADGSWLVSVVEELQDKSARYYFSNTINKPGNQIYISPLDLNIEQGQVVFPYEPTIRVAIPTLQADSLRSGVLVINYNLSPWFSALKKLASDVIQVELVNQKRLLVIAFCASRTGMGRVWNSLNIT